MALSYSLLWWIVVPISLSSNRGLCGHRPTFDLQLLASCYPQDAKFLSVHQCLEGGAIFLATSSDAIYLHPGMLSCDIRSKQRLCPCDQLHRVSVSRLHREVRS